MATGRGRGEGEGGRDREGEGRAPELEGESPPVATPPVELLEDRALPPVDLKSASGQHVLPEAFLESLALHFARREERFTTEGFDRLRQDWLAHAARLGETIHARAGETVTTGRFDGIDSEGALLLSTPKGITRLHAADVYFE